MRSVTQELVRFACKTRFGDLPNDVVDTFKRFFLDCIGCALGGLSTDKGKFAIKLAKRLGGTPESTIFGTSGRLSCAGAAFANGELIQALDMDPTLVNAGHTPPCLLSAPLALAECAGASGKDLILATVLGLDITARLGRAMATDAYERISEGPDKGRVVSMPVSGYGSAVLGGAAAASKILKLDQQKMSYAVGIAGAMAPVPAMTKWINSPPPSPMTKHGSAGWMAQAQVTAALLAEMGYIGDSTILDGEYGFWRFFGSPKWEPDAVVENIGQEWLFCERTVEYKPYPCCRVMHRALDCFINMIEKHNLMPDDMEKVTIWLCSLSELPLWTNTAITTHVDAQFSAPYVVSVAAHHINMADWQDLSTLRDPRILKFAEKVNVAIHPKFQELVQQDPRSWLGFPAAVEIVTKEKTFKEEATSAIKGDPTTEDSKMKDEELIEKFKNNASRILTEDKIDRAVESLFALEKMKNISELMKLVAL